MKFELLTIDYSSYRKVMLFKLKEEQMFAHKYQQESYKVLRHAELDSASHQNVFPKQVRNDDLEHLKLQKS
ncbi:hypothetical protein HME9304_02446 [Flagellimonas maritima]|uniref:Uncharacterized protein n=1 Tax=Flagellimonas maritima TaxID=1383885 RepID=A0A2Z4LUK8_9FLAO|nr:hypothetical protein HME9304_02446 [Allomuricauda aurantiaca]